MLTEANEAFGGSSDILSDGAEMCDVTIRCYLLGQAIENVAPDMWQDWEGSQEESEEEENEVLSTNNNLCTRSFVGAKVQII